jgi:predicted GIY-YIG superfamily endonuclease
MLHNKASGGSGVGPSRDIAKRMLEHDSPSYSRFTARGRNKAAEMSSKEGTKRAKGNVKEREKDKRRKKLMKTIEQAVKGYKRSGGVGERLKEGLGNLKKLRDN